MAEDRAFEHWYAREHARVFVSMLALAGDHDLAAEATDEAFARALQHWPRVSTMASPGGWTYRVALNAARRRWRRDQLERRLLPRLGRRETAPPAAGEVWLIVRDLPERQRIATVLRYVADMSEPDIAEVMGVTRGTVAATLAAARNTLRAALADETECEERS